MWYMVLKTLFKYFRMNLVSYEMPTLEELTEHHCYRSQEPHGVTIHKQGYDLRQVKKDRVSAGMRDSHS